MTALIDGTVWVHSTGVLMYSKATTRPQFVREKRCLFHSESLFGYIHVDLHILPSFALVILYYIIQIFNVFCLRWFSK
jgi:hypothetical protein